MQWFSFRQYKFLAEKNMDEYCMSSQTTPTTPPPPQWYPTMNPYSYPSDDVLSSMQNQAITTSIYDGTTRTTAAINDNTRFLNSEIAGVSKDINQSTLGLRDAVERGNLVNSHTVERTAAVTQSAIERTAGEGRLTTTVSDAASRQASADIARDVLRAIDHTGSALERTSAVTQSAIERVAGEGRLTTTVVDAASRQASADTARDIMRAVDHNGASLGTAIERNGNAAQVTSERIGGNISTSIERVAGENRLTTTVTDAASREASAMQARDLAVSIERNGANAMNATNTTYAGLLASIERNAGETRMAGSMSAGVTDLKMADIRHAILNDVNRGINEVMAGNTQSLNVITKAVTDGAWESRSSMANGFQNIAEEHLRTKHDLSRLASEQYASVMLENQKLAARGSDHYSSMLLEQQKMQQFMTSKSDNQFAINQLEMQKVKEGLACQAANNFSINQLEMQKVKEGLATQAANHFAISQLEAQKSKEILSAQMAEAKYEALKSQQLIVDKVGECCCEVREKMDLIDRDRLRDNLVVEREDNNLLKILEFSDFGRGDYGRGGHHHGRRGGRR